MHSLSLALVVTVVLCLQIATRGNSNVIGNNYEVNLPMQGDGNAILDSLLKLLKKNQGAEVLRHIASFPLDLQNLFDIAHCKARALAQIGRFTDSEEILRKLVEDKTLDDDERATAKLTLAKILVALRRFQEAYTLLTDVVQSNDSLAEAWLFLGKVYLQKDQDLPRAKVCMTRAFQLNAEDERIAFEYGMLLVQVGDAEGARKAFQLAGTLNPSIDRKYLARVYLHLHRVDWALAEFRTVANHTSAGAIDEEFALLWADAEDHEGFASQSLHIFDAILQQNPENALAHVGKACVLLGIGSGNHGAPYACGLHQDEALHHLTRAIEIADATGQTIPTRAKEAIQFCRLEVQEATQWQQILTRDFSLPGTSSNTQDKDNGTTNSSHNSLFKEEEHRPEQFIGLADPADNSPQKMWDPRHPPTSPSPINNVPAISTPPTKQNVHQQKEDTTQKEESMIHRMFVNPLQRFLFRASNHHGQARDEKNTADTTASKSDASASNQVATNSNNNYDVDKNSDNQLAETKKILSRAERLQQMRQNWERRATTMAALHDEDPLAVVALIPPNHHTNHNNDNNNNSNNNSNNNNNRLYRNKVQPRQLTFAQFHQEFMLHNRPAIITNFQQQWAPLLQALDSNHNDDNNNNKNNVSTNNKRRAQQVKDILAFWQTSSTATAAAAINNDNVKASLGDQIVRVSVTPDGRFDSVESGSLWGLSTSNDKKIENNSEKMEEVLVRPPQTSMLFKDFLTLLQQQSAPLLTETMYVEYLALHQYLGEEFLSMIPLPFAYARPVDALLHSSSSPAADLLKTTATATATATASTTPVLRPLVTNLWLSAGGTISPLHYDDYENFLSQLLGFKEVVLFPPQHNEYLYYTSRWKGELQYHYPGNFTRKPLLPNSHPQNNKNKNNQKSTAQQKKVIFGSSVHLDSPNRQQHPLYFSEILEKNKKENNKMYPQRLILAPGETLYLPAFWHHEVQSLPEQFPVHPDGKGGSVDVNCAVNYWFEKVTTPINETLFLSTLQ